MVEGPEDLRIVLANPSSNAEISDGEAFGTILDNDVVQISIGDAEPVVEGGELVFTVSLDQPALEDVTMEYTIALDGSAVSG